MRFEIFPLKVSALVKGEGISGGGRWPSWEIQQGVEVSPQVHPPSWMRLKIRRELIRGVCGAVLLRILVFRSEPQAYHALLCKKWYPRT